MSGQGTAHSAGAGHKSTPFSKRIRWPWTNKLSVFHIFPIKCSAWTRFLVYDFFSSKILELITQKFNYKMSRNLALLKCKYSLKPQNFQCVFFPSNFSS